MKKNTFSLKILLMPLCLAFIAPVTYAETGNETREDGPGIVIGRHTQGIYENEEKMVEDKLKETPLEPWEYDDVLRTHIALGSPAPKIEEMYRIVTSPALTSEQKIAELTKQLESLTRASSAEKHPKQPTENKTP